ncbi:MAG: glycosyltransferase [Verrucomicrobiaceae bacterium]
MTKPRIAFVGRVVHEQTRSDQFLVDLLSEVAEVKVFRREAMSDADLVAGIDQFKPHQTVFHQLPPSVSHHVLRLRSKNFVWVPMWDGFKKLNLRRRMIYRLFGVRFLCFSRSVFDYVRGISRRALHVQYYPEPGASSPACRDKPPYTVFLWQRVPELGLEDVVRIVGRENIAKVIVKSDFGAVTSSSVEVQNLPNWLPEDEYRAIFDQIDFYVAPRMQEGVGFSFLEAMARGIPVIGNDDATMNEYIEDGRTSLLFRGHQLCSGLASPARLRPALMEHMLQGRLRWMKAVPSVQSFVLGRNHG